MIELKSILKYYQLGATTIKALANIDISIEKGEMIVIGGVSGSGKSTLLNCIGGMDSPTEGEIIVDSENITRYSAGRLTDFRAKKIGFIFQNFNLIPALNVYENIVVPLKLKGRRFDKSLIIGLIDRVGLAGHIRHRPDELSGGQRQRVAIARALAHNPPYILADEPTANLDSVTAETIVELLKELNRNLGVTVIFASHDQFILSTVPRIIMLKDGMVVKG
jgi:putative ABC transport system ATP-binding protein